MNVQIFSLKGHDVEILYRNGSIAYTLNYEGKPYGVSLKLNPRLKKEQKKTENVVAVVYQLFTHAQDVLEELRKKEETK